MGKHSSYQGSSTQVAYPWRATVRSVFQGVLGFAAMWAVIVETLGIDAKIPWVAASLAFTAAVTRVMALGVVEDWLARYVPWLASEKPGSGDTPATVGVNKVENS